MRTINSFKVYTHILDYFALDGGSMFGTVPKMLWQKMIPSDDSNRIPLCGRVLFIETEDRKFIVDLGVGSNWDDKGRKIFSIENRYAGDISSFFSGVTGVILTHLHFDHCGWLSYAEPNTEQKKLSFPNATHYVSKLNYELAKSPNEREKGSYLSKNVELLKDAKCMFLEDGDSITKDISVTLLNGHTKGMMIVSINEASVPKLVFVSDLIPTSHHIPLQYIMGYDMCASTTLDERLKWYDLWCKHETILVFPHDRDCSSGILGFKDGRYYLKEKINLELELT